MDSISEAVLYSMFDHNGHAAPRKYLDIQKTLSREKVLTVSRETVMAIMESRGSQTFPESIEALVEHRNNIEFYGPNMQLIVAACIHNHDHFMALQLKHDPAFINGYHKGTLTYPQGHVNLGSIDEGIDKVTFNAMEFLDLLKNNIERELLEEITFKGINRLDEIEACIKELHIMIHDVTASQVIPIYINKADSTGSHLCMLFDIPIVPDCKFYKAFERNRIISNEPEKHAVKILDYRGIVDTVNTADDICVWMQKSFSVLPFMRGSFLRNTANL